MSKILPEPCGHRLLVKPDVLEETHGESGIILYVNEEQKRLERNAKAKGVVVAIGPTAWKTDAFGHKPWCQIGDSILYAKYAGSEVDEKYVIINDEDVVLVYPPEESK